MGPKDFVYIVDDDGDVLASTEFLLKSLGIGCRTFSSAEQLLHAITDMAPGCILTDLRMPTMSGLDLQAELLACSFDWPLIFMTGHGDIPTVVTAVKNGAIEFIQKPFSDEQLLTALHAGFAALRDRRISAGEAVRDALRRDKVLPHYQPKVDLSSGTVIGFEALLRWTPQPSHLDTCKAIHDAFEDRVLGAALTQRMLQQIFSDMAGWISSGVPFGHVAINASSGDLEDPDYVPGLVRALTKNGIPPEAVQVEVTETVTVDPSAHLVRSSLEKLSSAGIAIALDDFGTGFASLTHLQNLPVDVIKIDRSFLANLDSPSSASIIKAIVGLSKGLGKQVVAEGVETAAQAKFLVETGCEIGQGFLFGRAMPASEVPRIVAAASSSQPAPLGAPGNRQ